MDQKKKPKFMSVADIDFDKLMEGRRIMKAEKQALKDAEKLAKLEKDLNKPIG